MKNKSVNSVENYDALCLKNQLCFPIYAASNMIIKKYKPLLDKLDLTYTQYIVMMVLWEKKEINVKELGKCVFLDSGTLTPLLKKLESKEYIKRTRSKKDERILLVSITKKGEELKKEAIKVPCEMQKKFCIDDKEAKMLYDILYKMLNNYD